MQPAKWIDFDPSFIRHRYNRIAKVFPFFEWLFLLPPGIRRKAVNRMRLLPGDRVLEIGCGTGRNLDLLRQVVGPEGHIYGVDSSEGMLEEAKVLRASREWENVTLVHGDALNYSAPEQVDGVLFSLSYATMPHHREVLAHAWNQLRPGKRLVIMDAKLPSGMAGKLLLPGTIWIMRKTVLGNPLIRPWDELAELTEEFSMEEILFGSYYICDGRKQQTNARQASL